MQMFDAVVFFFYIYMQSQQAIAGKLAYHIKGRLRILTPAGSDPVQGSSDLGRWQGSQHLGCHYGSCVEVQLGRTDRVRSSARARLARPSGRLVRDPAPRSQPVPAMAAVAAVAGERTASGLGSAAAAAAASDPCRVGSSWMLELELEPERCPVGFGGWRCG